MVLIITNIMVELGSTVSTVTRLRAGQPRICIPILIMGKGYFCSPIFHTVRGALLATFSDETEAFHI